MHNLPAVSVHNAHAFAKLARAVTPGTRAFLAADHENADNVRFTSYDFNGFCASVWAPGEVYNLTYAPSTPAALALYAPEFQGALKSIKAKSGGMFVRLGQGQRASVEPANVPALPCIVAELSDRRACVEAQPEHRAASQVTLKGQALLAALDAVWPSRPARDPRQVLKGLRFRFDAHDTHGAFSVTATNGKVAAQRYPETVSETGTLFQHGHTPLSVAVSEDAAVSLRRVLRAMTPAQRKENVHIYLGELLASGPVFPTQDAVVTVRGCCFALTCRQPGQYPSLEQAYKGSNAFVNPTWKFSVDAAELLLAAKVAKAGMGSPSRGYEYTPGTSQKVTAPVFVNFNENDASTVDALEVNALERTKATRRHSNAKFQISANDGSRCCHEKGGGLNISGFFAADNLMAALKAFPKGATVDVSLCRGPDGRVAAPVLFGTFDAFALVMPIKTNAANIEF